MSCQVSTTTITVAKGAQIAASLPKTGVLRFAREDAAMSGTPYITAEGGEMALSFADGASITLKDI